MRSVKLDSGRTIRFFLNDETGKRQKPVLAVMEHTGWFCPHGKERAEVLNATVALLYWQGLRTIAD